VADVSGQWRNVAVASGLLADDGSLAPTIFARMTALATKTGAINLGQGFPDTDGPAEVLDAARAAIAGGFNQYPPGRGVPALRQAIAEHQQRRYGLSVDPDTEVLVTAGATEAIAATVLALCSPGDEVVVLEPYYDSYAATIALGGAVRRPVPLTWPDFALDLDALAAAVTDRTRLLLFNNPHNPTGRVFTRAEMTMIAELCAKHDVWVITDEIYEHIRYAGDHHVMATWPGMRDRTITISGLSKTFSCTGWRLGYVVAPEEQTAAIRKVHDFLTVGAPAPLQAAGAVGMHFDADYYNHLALDYRSRRTVLCDALTESGFAFTQPEGAYYVLADFSGLSDMDDVSFAKWMCQEIGVATVPGSSFYSKREDGRSLVRFAFCKKYETLKRAAERLATVRTSV
jgi:aspartate/methionine/tyrosine aminotransferase